MKAQKKPKAKRECPYCQRTLRAYSAGLFPVDNDKSDRVCLEILWYCSVCPGISLTEHYIKPENADATLRRVGAEGLVGVFKDETKRPLTEPTESGPRPIKDCKAEVFALLGRKEPGSATKTSTCKSTSGQSARSIGERPKP